MDTTSSRVLAILIAHDGEAWLEASLSALLAQDHPDLEVLAVDNGSSDGSRMLLLEYLGEDHVLVAERDLGFGAAVSMALDASRAADADFVLFVHDDCVLAPDAVTRLADHLGGDGRLAVVGAKLVDWDDPGRLQSVGWSVDLTGRADSGLEPDELDQGQRDHVQRALYVSTAAMMVRRSAFEELGRFDRRYHLFRDDLDVCWRAWLAGWDVEVVPAAVGRHAASATNYDRLGQTAFLGPRYFAERNTLATLLKNYGLARLAVVLPLFLVVGVAKVLGFVATRRFSDAWQTVRAWLWNVAHLRETRRLRQTVQSTRQRSDGELRDLFAKVAPRLRAYAEAVGEWLAGSELDTPDPDEVTEEPATATSRVAGYVRTHPVSTAALTLAALGLVIALPLLAGGPLRGGELAPWPASPRAFLDDYISSWHDAGGVGTSRSPSPAQAILAFVHVLALGSSWLAPRLLLLGALPLAWVFALRAGAFVTEKRVPRVAAATAYVLSPPALTALITGRIGTLVVVVALPALLAAYATAMRTDAAPDDAWRATAAAAIVAAVAIAFEPVFLLAFLLWLVLALGLAAGHGGPRSLRRRVVVRVLATGLGTFLLLFPWSVSLFGEDSPVFGGVAPVGADARPFWQVLLLSPTELLGVPGAIAGIGFLLAGVLGVVFGFSRRPLAVISLWAVAIAGVYAAWGLGRAGEGAWTWPGLPLVVVAAALSGLLVIAMSTAGPQLAAHTFGWRQVAAGTTAVAITLGLAVSAASLLDAPWGAFEVGTPALPAFISVEEEAAGDFRVLVLADEEGVVSWDVTGPGGPTMASYGVPVPRRFVDAVRGDIEDVVSGADPGAAGRLGLFNIRYVVVPEDGRTPELSQVLGDQLDLEPQPVAEGEVLRVTGWLPRAAFLPAETVDTVVRRGEVARDSEEVPLERDGTAPRFVGEAEGPGSILVSDIATTAWRAMADGRRLELATQEGLLRFDVDAPADRVVVEHAHQARRTVLVVVQLVVLLIALSLMLRPPRFAQEVSR